MTANAVEVPNIGEWLASQHLNVNPEMAAAARYIGSRWELGTWYRHAKTLRVLAAEKSEHLYGAQLLTQEYAECFGLGPMDEIKQYSLSSPLIPTDRVQCEHRFASGKLCSRDSVPGTVYCGVHGGQWITEDERARIVEQVSSRLIELSERAIECLADLMDNAKSEHVRYEASVAVLDRIGIGPTQKVEMSMTESAEETANVLLSRLADLRPKALEHMPIAEDFIDAEVVEDTEPA